MKKMKGSLMTVAVAVALGVCLSGTAWTAEVIRIGLIRDAALASPADRPFGWIRMIGENINAAGGLKVGSTMYKVEFVQRGWELKTADLEWNTKNAVEATTKLIRDDEVFAVIGPGAVVQAIVADICNTYEVININYNDLGTSAVGRPWVFTVQATEEYLQGALARFAQEELNAESAAVVYTIDALTSRLRAFAFRDAFESINGKGSVVVFDSDVSQKTLDGDIDPQIIRESWIPALASCMRQVLLPS